MTEITWDELDLYERAALKIVPDEWTDANDLPGIAHRLMAAMHRVHNKGLLELETHPGMIRLWRRAPAGRALVQAAHVLKAAVLELSAQNERVMGYAAFCYSCALSKEEPMTYEDYLAVRKVEGK